MVFVVEIGWKWYLLLLRGSYNQEKHRTHGLH